MKQAFESVTRDYVPLTEVIEWVSGPKRYARTIVVHGEAELDVDFDRYYKPDPIEESEEDLIAGLKIEDQNVF